MSYHYGYSACDADSVGPLRKMWKCHVLYQAQDINVPTIHFFFSQVLGGRFLDRWVLEHVRQLVSIRENPRNPTASEHLVSQPDQSYSRSTNVAPPAKELLFRKNQAGCIDVLDTFPEHAPRASV